jgi:dephospho-CoA kinase
VIRVFGLTGGIGSGKTTIGRRFEERGVGVVDADELAREVVRAGSEGLAAIRERFGDGVIGADGTLDRAALARVVFGDEGAKAALEAITHPRIRTLARERFAALERDGALLGCYVVPLLYERGLESEYSPVVVVNATPEQQRERARLRDAAPEEAIEARMRAQLPLSDKVEWADFVIDNTGAIEDALEQADQVLDALCLQFGIDPARFPRSRHPASKISE